MLIYISTIIFAAAIALFFWSFYRRFRLLLLGRPEPENRFNNIGKRIGGVLYYAFGQRCTVSHGYRFGWNHLVLFWSFMILLIANTEFLLEGLFPDSISFSLLPSRRVSSIGFFDRDCISPCPAGRLYRSHPPPGIPSFLYGSQKQWTLL